MIIQKTLFFLEENVHFEKIMPINSYEISSFMQRHNASVYENTGKKRDIGVTRGPKGHCCSPEYNECVKNLTSEWNQKMKNSMKVLKHINLLYKHSAT